MLRRLGCLRPAASFLLVGTETALSRALVKTIPLQSRWRDVAPVAVAELDLLGHDRWRTAGVEPIRDWREALHEAFPALLAAERG